MRRAGLVAQAKARAGSAVDSGAQANRRAHEPIADVNICSCCGSTPEDQERCECCGDGGKPCGPAQGPEVPRGPSSRKPPTADLLLHASEETVTLMAGDGVYMPVRRVVQNLQTPVQQDVRSPAAVHEVVLGVEGGGPLEPAPGAWATQQSEGYVL